MVGECAYWRHSVFLPRMESWRVGAVVGLVECDGKTKEKMWRVTGGGF